MRALSLWQPWATAIVIDAKRVETRGWSTNYRGPLLIHASKRWNQAEMIEHASSWTWCAALSCLGMRIGSGRMKLLEILPLGAIVGVADLIDCRTTESFALDDLDARRTWKTGEKVDSLDTWTEEMMGNFGPGRFGWVLRNPRRFAQPIPYRGAQGLFEIPAEVVAAAMAAA